MSESPPPPSFQRSTRPKDQNLPGWNDPPPLQFSSQSTNIKPKLNLSKRVAFPLANCSNSKPTAIIPPHQVSANLSTSLPPTQTTIIATAPIAVVPPMPQYPPQSVCILPPQNQLPPSALTSSSAQQVQRVPPMIPSPAEETENENLQEYCVNIFQQHILQFPEPNNTNFIRTDEIQRRIHLIQETWNAYSAAMHRKLFNIAKALELKNYNDAIENHRQLVIEHSATCTQWAPALRQIILTIQENSINDNNTNETAQVPLINNIILSTTELENDSSANTNLTKASISPFSVQHI